MCSAARLLDDVSNTQLSIVSRYPGRAPEARAGAAEGLAQLGAADAGLRHAGLRAPRPAARAARAAPARHHGDEEVLQGRRHTVRL